MKKVHFSPLCAIRYVGDEPKEFSASLARPKPVLEYGDIVILDKRTAYNLVKGLGQYESVEAIEIPDADELLDECERLKGENKHLNDECERLKGELAKALEFLSVDDETVNTDEVPPVDETANTDEVPPVDETVNTDEVPPVDETVNTNEAPPVDETVNTDEVPPVDETAQPKITRGKITSKKQS